MSEPWTITRGPIQARDIDIEKAAVVNALLVRPIAILPNKEGDAVRPFAIGLFEEIRLLLKPEIAPTRLRRAIAAYIHTSRYYFASAQPDAFRHDIDGEPVEAISDADRMTAQRRFTALKKMNSKAGAQIASAPVAEPAPQSSKNDQIRAGLLSRRMAPR
jgi:sRNA-binding protein